MPGKGWGYVTLVYTLFPRPMDDQPGAHPHWLSKQPTEHSLCARHATQPHLTTEQPHFYYAVCCCLVTKSCLTLFRPHGLQPVRLLCPHDSPRRILRCFAISCSKGSFWPRDWTQVSCIGRWILYHWASMGSPIMQFTPDYFKWSGKWQNIVWL